MVDTTTPVLGFVKQTPGGNRNTWGSILNTNFDMLEEAICGRFSITTTGGTTTLTAAQARNRQIYVTGTLISDATIVVPISTKDWLVLNNCNGAFAVLIQTPGGTPTSVPQFLSKEIYGDGVANVHRADFFDVGQMAFFASGAAPFGWVECNGQALSRTGIGVDLFARIGTTWGGSGSTFNVPDAYTAGRFLRSRSASLAIGTAQNSQNLAHTHTTSAITTTLSGNTLVATDTQGAHTHGGTNLTNTDHRHTVDGDTGGESVHHNHSILFQRNGTQVGGSFFSCDLNLTGGSGGTQNNTVDHSHHLTITSSFVSNGPDPTQYQHAHTINSDGGHAHVVDFSKGTATTTFTINNDTSNTEARPTNLVAILCIKL